ncbi:Undecaprenyl-phosphate 4-deoxy-4-formamido-L-arabinose transferase [Rosistilla carotiformis]|uniref:Undecaprenyl-phosphate 4-deoxy-4-formamido-L-arabinose transferase n=1 Tax=Rosistilla carotiformis TaxID=2528017 RepID=A0A518JUD4_9BACT|nr:glycosyltransferase family 2 protein [Rosistilla carotiformis]QDV69145.1 Undecaprenyl-phosphate 4-deoxy-4-formamido-L-arabinose transferase [Rosistilla carotiformis]
MKKSLIATSSQHEFANAELPSRRHDSSQHCERLLDEAESLVQQAIDDAQTDAPELSVVIPVFNERETLPQVIAAVQALPITKEIIVVDDGSSDGTADWLASQRGKSGLTIVLRRRNRGKGSALRMGFRHCRGEIIAIQDADLEYDPRDLMKVIRPIQDGLSDIAYGSRYLGNHVQDPSFLHRLGNRVLTGLSNVTTGLRLTDMETCYKAFRRDLIQGLTLRQCRFGFEPEVTAKLARSGQRFMEVPIEYQSRGYDEGKKIGWRDGVNAIYCMLRYSRWD